MLATTLAAGESPTDLGLMAHEATHVAQQSGATVHPMIMRDIEVTDVIPNFILDGVRDWGGREPSSTAR
jgi:hypothetical protein